MKRVIALAFVAVTCSIPAANAAAPKGPTMAQFTALQKQLKKDEKRIKDLEGLTNATLAVMLCQNAITADALQGTWQEIDALATSVAKPTMFGPQTAIADGGACTAFKIPRSNALPPTTSPFSALAALITG